MFVPGLIERKRDGGVLASGEFRELMDGTPRVRCRTTRWRRC